MLMSMHTQSKHMRMKHIWLWRSVLCCYVMHLVYNHDRTTSQNHAHFLRTKACIVTMHIILLPQLASKKAVVHDWGFVVFDQNLWKLIPSVIIFRNFCSDIQISELFHISHYIGYPVLGGYKEILKLDVTIFPCILLQEIQYYIGWPKKNATTLIVNFKNIVDETELFFLFYLVEHSFSNKMTPWSLILG